MYEMRMCIADQRRTSSFSESFIKPFPSSSTSVDLLMLHLMKEREKSFVILRANKTHRHDSCGLDKEQ